MIHTTNTFLFFLPQYFARENNVPPQPSASDNESHLSFLAKVLTASIKQHHRPTPDPPTPSWWLHEDMLHVIRVWKADETSGVPGRSLLLEDSGRQGTRKNPTPRGQKQTGYQEVPYSKRLEAGDINGKG